MDMSLSTGIAVGNEVDRDHVKATNASFAYDRARTEFFDWPNLGHAKKDISNNKYTTRIGKAVMKMGWQDIIHT